MSAMLPRVPVGRDGRVGVGWRDGGGGVMNSM